jgi:hypothetical protein
MAQAAAESRHRPCSCTAPGGWSNDRPPRVLDLWWGRRRARALLSLAASGAQRGGIADLMCRLGDRHVPPSAQALAAPILSLVPSAFPVSPRARPVAPVTGDRTTTRLAAFTVGPTSRPVFEW